MKDFAKIFFAVCALVAAFVYGRKYGEESIPRIPWNEPPPPSAPDILSDYQSSPLQPDNRSKESDYDNEM